MASAKLKLKDYFLTHIGVDTDRETLREISGGIHDWQRSLRQLRQDTGLNITRTKKGYILNSEIPVKPPHPREPITQKLRFAVLQRDNSLCQRCGRGIGDGVNLNVDHKLPVDMGGKTTMNNLWTLCDMCNGGKKSFFSDEDSELMRDIQSLSSADKRLKEYFKNNPNSVIPVTKLQIIANVRDWERALRNIRAKDDMDIQYVRPDKENPIEGYIYKK